MTFFIPLYVTELLKLCIIKDYSQIMNYDKHMLHPSCLQLTDGKFLPLSLPGLTCVGVG